MGFILTLNQNPCFSAHQVTRLFDSELIIHYKLNHIMLINVLLILLMFCLNVKISVLFSVLILLEV